MNCILIKKTKNKKKTFNKINKQQFKNILKIY